MELRVLLFTELTAGCCAVEGMEWRVVLSIELTASFNA